MKKDYYDIAGELDSKINDMGYNLSPEASDLIYRYISKAYFKGKYDFEEKLIKEGVLPPYEDE
jgi:hypothetical protein